MQLWGRLHMTDVAHGGESNEVKLEQRLAR